MNPADWQRVKKILEAAIEREPSERPAYLDEACHDPAIRREVESLLAAHDEASGSFLAEGPGIRPRQVVIGNRLGSYVVNARIGEGGMGVVYSATDIKLGRRVALKVLPSEMGYDPERLARFRREARSVAALNHPNIVTLYSIDEEDGIHFLVMELIQGKPLHQIVREPKLALDTHLRIAASIAEALAAAHERNIIHRDLKPSNVMLTTEGRVKVLDFGLAKEIPPENTTIVHSLQDAYTGEGALLGTPAYMSPEQTRGESVTRASDIFSLGILYYEMATSRHPFSSNSAVGFLNSISTLDPVPPSRLRPEIPKWFEKLLLRMLQKEPEKRCTAAEIVSVFRDQDSRENAEEHFANEEDESLARRRLSLVESLPDGPYLNRTEFDFQTTLVSGLPGGEPQATGGSFETHPGAQELSKEAGAPPVAFIAEVRVFWTAFASSDFAKARGQAELCLRTAEEKGDSGLIMQAHYMLGSLMFHFGEHLECDRRIRKASSLYDPVKHAKFVKVFGIDTRVNGTALLGLNLWHLGFADQARAKVRESIEIARTVPHPASLALALVTQTFLCDFLEDARTMHDCSCEVIAIAQHHSLRADTLIWGKFGKAWALARLGNAEEGWPEMRSAIADAEGTAMTYAVPTLRWALAGSLARNGRSEEAMALINQSLLNVGQTWPRDKLSEYFRMKGELLLGRDLASDAEKLFESALDTARKSGALAHELRAAMSLARLYLKKGEPDARERILPPVFDLFTEGFQTPDLQEAKALIQKLEETANASSV